MERKTEKCGNITGWQLLLLLLITSLMTTAVEAATGEVDVSIVYQELEGFGASGAWYENWLLGYPTLERNELYDILFDQLGLDIYRLRNAYDQGSGGADYIEDSGQIVAAAKARNPSLKIMISSWSPPGYLKSTGDTYTYNGTLAGGPSSYVYTDFANWWYNSLTDFSNHGINADYVNMQNEPDFSPGPPPKPEWDSCRFNPTENSTFAGYQEAFQALYAKLNSEMPDHPKLLVPEAVGINASKSYIDVLTETDKSNVYGYAHHLYGDGDMASFAASYGYKPLLQTEYSAGASTFTDAMNLAILMHNSLTIESVSAYLYWELFWEDPKGLVSLIDPWGSATYTINPVYYAFKHYAAFTDPGWHRVKASTSSSYLRISAFKSADNTKLSIVIINVSTIGGILLSSLSFDGFSPVNSEVYRTSETENTEYIGTFDGSLLLPHQSITTISLTGSSPPAICAEVLAGGYRLASDISGDCYVDYRDLQIIADYWLYADCETYNDCEGADLEPSDDPDGDVDFFDFGTFAPQWMQCNDPQDANCTPNW